MRTRVKLETLLYPVAILLIVAVLLLAERFGVAVPSGRSEARYLSETAVAAKPDYGSAQKECLLLVDSTFPYQEDYLKQMEYVLRQMWVGYDRYDVSRGGALPDLSAYQTAIVAFPDLSKLGGDLVAVNDWVASGGRAMYLYPCEPSPTFSALADKLGVKDGGTSYSKIYSLEIKTDFMVGGKGFQYVWGDYPFVALSVSLKPEATAHIVSDAGVPLLWETPYGKGRFVVNNFDMIEKITRGYLGAAYSLLYDEFAWPVINSAVFFLDDFPSPVPMGDGEYIKKFFNRDISSFYSSVWWPDLLELGRRYDVKYTGMVIETYEDQVNAPFLRNNDISRFQYFGRMLLGEGGEIGFHGYNHQPICFDGFDYEGKLGYKLWHSQKDAELAVRELSDFCHTLFPKETFSVYVPPSNILSPEGRALLVSKFPEIKTLAGVYLKENFEYEQEFCVSEDGIIEFPRIISGTQIDSYMQWTALNELNFHFVSSHFMHPDDTLDVDRGAALGWNKMREGLERYMQWLFDAAPSIRRQTASEASGAVQRYDSLGLARKNESDGLRLDITNFHDEAHFLLRIREGAPRAVEGGALEPMGGELYALKATAPQVTIKIER